MKRTTLLRIGIALLILASLGCEADESQTEKTCRFWFEAQQKLDGGEYPDGIDDARFLADLHKIDDTLLQSEPLVLFEAENLIKDIAKGQIEDPTLTLADIKRRGDRLAQACVDATAWP